MILVVKRSNILLSGLIFFLIITVYSLNYQPAGTVATIAQGQTRTVILDAGHGGEDPGAVSDYTGIKEKDLTLKIACGLKELLENDNYKVIMTREEDILQYEESTTNIIQKRKQDLVRRKNIMDTSGADITVSIHFNKFPQTQYCGAQTFYPPDSPQSFKLAASIQEALKKLDPTNKRTALVKKEPIIILKNLKTTTVIVEGGFLSNNEEEKKLASEDYQKRLAEFIKEGIDNYFD